jgi:hypothetical protein
MTVETFTPAPIYTVAGIGPYAITHPYTTGAIRALVTVDAVEVALDSGSFSVTPAAAAVSGNLFLSPTAASTHAGRKLRIERDTTAEQGWLGVQGEREKSLEAQLDRLTYVAQELDAISARTLRTRDPVASFVPVAGATLLFDGTAIVPGPTVEDIEAAQPYAAAAASSAAAAAASSLAAAQSAATASLYDPMLRFPTRAAMLAATRGPAGPGSIWQAGRDWYVEAAAAAVDQHATTAGGVKLYAEPFWIRTDQYPAAPQAGLAISPSDIVTPRNLLFVRQETAERSDSTAVQIQRVVTTDDGHVNPKALRALTVITGGGGDQIEYAISGEVENSDNTRSGAEGGAAVSGVALKKAANTGIMFGAHFQVKDETGAATVGGIVGVECNIQGNGADTNANRFGFDIIARTFGAGAAGVFTAGVRIRNSEGAAGGRWTHGVLIEDGAQTVLNGITIDTSPGASGYGISDTGSKPVGLLLAGAYGAAAIRMNAGQAIAFEASAAIKLRYDSGDLSLGIYNGASRRFRLETDPTPAIHLNDVPVLRERRIGWTPPTGVSSRATFDTASVSLVELAQRVRALIDDLTAHGLIGA